MEPDFTIRLTVFHPMGRVQHFEHADFELTIGSLDSNGLVLAGEGVDKRHAKVVLRDGKYTLLDSQSDSGTFVNGERLTEWTSPSQLEPGDRVQIGQFVLCLGHHHQPPPERRRGILKRLLGS